MPESIFWIAPDMPLPLDKGGRIRSFAILSYLVKQRRVVYFGLQQSEADIAGKERSFCTDLISAQGPAEVLSATQKAKILVASLLNGLPYSIARVSNRDLRYQVKAALDADPDSNVVCDFAHAAVNIPKKHWSRLAVFHHNVEAQLWHRRAAQQQKLSNKLLYRIQARLMAKFEGCLARTARLNICVSDNDAAVLRKLYGPIAVTTIPTSVTLADKPAAHTKRNHFEILFVGSMDWQPNEEAVKWFISFVWPKVCAAIPDCRFTVVGRYPAAAMLDLAKSDPRITFTGRVDSVGPYLERAVVSVVPILAGGGTRMKIYESIAAQLPVVSTTIGAEGLGLERDVHLLIADSAESFASSTIELLVDTEKARRLADRAYLFVSDNFSDEKVARRFGELVDPPSPLCPPAIARPVHES